MSEREIHREYAKRYDDGSYHHDRRTTLELRPRRPSYFIHQLIINIWYITLNFHLFFNLVAREERFELPTLGFGDRCSTNWATPVCKPTEAGSLF